MNYARDDSMRQALAEAETLIDQVAKLQGSPAGEQVEQLVAMVLDLHADALRRIIRTLKQAGQPGDEILQNIARDEFLASVLLLHDLHPQGMEDRVRLAVGKIRPYLQSHGGDVELVGVADGSANLRLQGSCGGCAAMTNSLKAVIEKAVYDAAPDIDAINIEVGSLQ